MRHRAAWEERYGSIPPGLYVCHDCDNPPCWNLEHLFLGTSSDNAVDRERKGRGVDNRGERNAKARLREADVCLIRQRVASGELQRIVGGDFGVSQARVSAIVRRRSWASHSCGECAR
jgi:hypothetical protein